MNFISWRGAQLQSVPVVTVVSYCPLSPIHASIQASSFNADWYDKDVNHVHAFMMRHSNDENLCFKEMPIDVEIQDRLIKRTCSAEPGQDEVLELAWDLHSRSLGCSVLLGVLQPSYLRAAISNNDMNFQSTARSCERSEKFCIQEVLLLTQHWSHPNKMPDSRTVIR